MDLAFNKWLSCARPVLSWGSGGERGPMDVRTAASRKLAVRALCAQDCEGVNTGDQEVTRQGSLPRPVGAEKVSTRSNVGAEG